MAHRPDLAISVSNYSRRYSTTPCANVLLDEVVLNFFKSLALWAGLFTLHHRRTQILHIPIVVETKTVKLFPTKVSLSSGQNHCLDSYGV